MTSTNTIYKIALLGEEGVGKTALLVRFLCHRYIVEYDPSIEDIYRRHVKLDDEDLTVDFLDTSSRRPETSIKDSFIKRCDGFLFIYSMTDRNSFLEMPKYKNMIEKSRDDNSCPVHVVLAANKSDLHEHRTVSWEEGRNMAVQYGWTFAEVSAAIPNGVDKIFNELIRELQFQNNMMHLGEEQTERPRSLSLNGFLKQDSLKVHRLSDVSSSSPCGSSSDSDHSNSNLVLPHSKHAFNFKKLLNLRSASVLSRRGSH